MAKALLIAEKNSMCKTIKEAIDKYGFHDDIEYATFAGHVVRQKYPGEYKDEWKKWNIQTLPMIPDKIEYVKDENKAAMYDSLKKKIENGNYDYLICATDAAREGNLIFAAFYDSIGCKLPVKRFFNQSLTPKTIKQDIDNLLDWDIGRMKRLTDSAYLRAEFDSLSGYNFSRAYTLAKGLREGVGLGRVMSPVTNIVVERELAIRNFKSETYYEIIGQFKKDNILFFTTALNEDEKVLSFKDKKDATAFINSLNGQSGKVSDVSKTKSKQTAPELFSLATLQNEANSAFGYTLQETLDIAQTLYEAKWITYPRTESSHLTKSVAEELGNLLKICAKNPTYGKFVSAIKSEDISRVKGDKKYVDDSKVSDHYALIPTEITPDYQTMTPKQRNVYDLIVRQFVAIFYGPLIVDKTTVMIDVDNHMFRGKGSVLIDAGYTVLFNSSISENELPALKKGEILSDASYDTAQKKTSAPKRFNDKTLNEAMMYANRFVEDAHEKQIMKEAEGIGKPSTRAAILEKCFKNGLLERKRTAIYPSEFAISIMQDLKGEDIISVSLTAIWEEKLKMVESGDLSYDNFHKEMIKYITEETLKLTKFTGGNIVDKNNLGKCPICGKAVVASDKFYKCINYKGGTDAQNPCTFIIGKDYFGTKINEANAKLLLEGKPTKLLKFKSQAGKEYEASLVYDAKEMKLVKQFADNSKDSSVDKGAAKVQVKTGEKCPQCGHDMVLRDGKYGKFEACSNYPSCKYIKPKESSKPAVEKTGEKCPQCGHDMVYRNGQYGKFEACSNYPACKYIKKN